MHSCRRFPAVIGSSFIPFLLLDIFILFTKQATATEDIILPVEKGNVHTVAYNSFVGQFEDNKQELLADLADSLLSEDFPELEFLVMIYPKTYAMRDIVYEKESVGYGNFRYPLKIIRNGSKITHTDYTGLIVYLCADYLDVDAALHLIYAAAANVNAISINQSQREMKIRGYSRYVDSLPYVDDTFLEMLRTMRYPKVTERLHNRYPFAKVVLNQYDSVMIDYVNGKYCLYEYEKVINVHFNSEDKSITKESAPDYFLRVNDIKEFSNNSFPFLFTDDSTMYVVGYNYPVSSPPIYIPCIESVRYLFNEYSITSGIGDEPHLVLNMRFPRRQMYVLYFSKQHKIISDYQGDLFFPAINAESSSAELKKPFNPLVLPCITLFILCCILVAGSGRSVLTSD